MSRQQKPSRRVSVDEQIQVGLAGLTGESSPAEAAPRHGVSSSTMGNWRDRFVDTGQAGMDRPAGDLPLADHYLTGRSGHDQ